MQVSYRDNSRYWIVFVSPRFSSPGTLAQGQTPERRNSFLPRFSSSLASAGFNIFRITTQVLVVISLIWHLRVVRRYASFYHTTCTNYTALLQGKTRVLFPFGKQVHIQLCYPRNFSGIFTGLLRPVYFRQQIYFRIWYPCYLCIISTRSSSQYPAKPTKKAMTCMC